MVVFTFFSCLSIEEEPTTLTDNNNQNNNNNNNTTDNNNNNQTPDPVCNSNSCDESPLLITEVGYSRYLNSPIWIEIYNSSSNQVVNLADYSLRTLALNNNNTTTAVAKRFTLPDKVINPNDYLIIRGNNFREEYSSLNLASSQVIYINDRDDFYPFFQNNGFFELLFQENNTVDFMRFGNLPVRPLDSSQWSGGSVSTFLTTIPGDGYGQSISRKFDFVNSVYLDTQQASDWEIVSYSTRGGVNDVIFNTDNDGDGIPDSAEAPGRTFAGLPLYDWGARPGKKDIFIEIDYMAQGTGAFLANNTKPNQSSLNLVKDAFAKQGYVIHFDVGDLFDQNPSSLNLNNMDLGGGNEVPFSPGIDLIIPSSGNTVSFYEIKAANMAINRREIFYYMVIANSLKKDGSRGNAGVAEVLGNDSIISIGSFKFTGNVYINVLASTIMHEFGHNLGLRHGGDENNNYKPNYISVMNYLYLFGLPDIGNREGDRYYLENYTGNSNCLRIISTSQLQNSPNRNNFVIDFSDGSGAIINENVPINEFLGLGRTGSTAVDYNCDNIIANNLPEMNLNPKYNTTQEELKDHNDWANIQLVFRRYSAGSYGSNLDKTTPRFIPFDPIFEDNQQEITVEDKDLFIEMTENLKNYHHNNDGHHH